VTHRRCGTAHTAHAHLSDRARGTAKLYIDDSVVAETPLKTQPGKFTPSGEGHCVGYDRGDAVSNA
jgi:hypothetical protein